MSAAPRKASFEKHLAELEAIVERLEQGEVPLEDLLVQYETGMKHLREAQRILQEAELRIEQLKKAGEQIQTAPFSFDQEEA